MKQLIQFQADDGSIHQNPASALKRDRLFARVQGVMSWLGSTPKGVEDGNGWIHHDLATVNKVKDALFDICREEGFHENFKIFKEQGSTVHAHSIAGRILDDNGGPIARAWSRIGRIDEQGREHQQAYYALNMPRPEHFCVEDRR